MGHGSDNVTHCLCQLWSGHVHASSACAWRRPCTCYTIDELHANNRHFRNVGLFFWRRLIALAKSRSLNPHYNQQHLPSYCESLTAVWHAIAVFAILLFPSNELSDKNIAIFSTTKHKIRTLHIYYFCSAVVHRGDIQNIDEQPRRAYHVDHRRRIAW